MSAEGVYASRLHGFMALSQSLSAVEGHDVDSESYSGTKRGKLRQTNEPLQYAIETVRFACVRLCSIPDHPSGPVWFRRYCRLC